MLAMTLVIVGKCAFVCFLTFYILQTAPKRRGVASPSTSPLDGPGCIKNALINLLKKLKQCFNALKKLTLRQL